MSLRRKTARTLASGALLFGLTSQSFRAQETSEPRPPDVRALVEAAAIEAATLRIAPPDRLEILSARFGGADPVTVAVSDVEMIDIEGPNASGILRVRFRLLSRGTVLGSARASVRGVVRGPVLVANRPLPNGRPIPRDAVERIDADLTRLAGDPVRDHAALADRVPVRTLGAGRPLSDELLKPRPLVRRGQTVNLTIRRNGLAVSVKAAAKRDGAPGDTVPAENLSTGVRLLGRVLEDGSLLVVEGAAPGRTR